MSLVAVEAVSLGAGEVGLERGFEVGLDLGLGFERIGDAAAFERDLVVEFGDLRGQRLDGRVVGQQGRGALGLLALQAAPCPG